MKKLLILIFAFINIQQAFAQSSLEEKKKTRPFKIASWGDWKSKQIFIPSPDRSEKKMVPLEILDMGYSKDYFIKNGSTFNLYNETNNEEEPYAIALQITIPASIKKPLVMLSRDEEGKANYKIYDIDPVKFPYGTYQLVNTTKLSLKTVFGKKRQDLKPGSRSFIQLSTSERDKAIHCKIGVSQNSKTKLVWENMLRNRSTKRMLMFIYATKDEVGRPAVKCKSLVDFEIKKKEITN